MKFQHIFYTTALSIAVAAGSSAAFAQNDEEALDPVDRHGGLEVEITEAEKQKAEAKAAQDRAHKEARDGMKQDKEDTSMNTNKTDVMRERAADMDEHPNSATRAVPGAPHAGKNPDIEPEAGEHDFIE